MLGAHVRHGAKHRACRRHWGGRRDARNPKVRDHRALRCAVEEDVLRLHVTVNDTARVGVAKRIEHVVQNGKKLRASKLTLGVNPMRQRLAVDVAHHEEDHTGDVVGAVHWHDVGMGQRRGGAGFAEKAVAHDGVGAQVRRERLDGDQTIQPLVSGDVHNAHAPATDFSVDIILPLESGSDVLELPGGRSHGSKVVITLTHQETSGSTAQSCAGDDAA